MLPAPPTPQIKHEKWVGEYKVRESTLNAITWSIIIAILHSQES
jgi:hypothetical protein